MEEQHSCRAMYKICNDDFARIKGRMKRNFDQIWIAMEKQLMNNGSCVLLFPWTYNLVAMNVNNTPLL